MCAYEEEIETLASNRMTGYNLGRLISSYFTPFLLTILVATRLGHASYYTLTLFSTSLLFVCYFVTFKLSKGYEGNGRAGRLKAEKLTAQQIGKAIISAPQFIPLIIADVTSTLGSFLLPGLLVYMYRYVIQGGDMMTWMATHNLATGIATLGGAYMARWVMKRIENKKVLLILMYLCIAVFIFSTRFVTQNVYLFIALSAIGLFFQGITQPIENTLIYDVALIANAKTGEDATSTFIALGQYNARIAGLLRGVIISVLFNAIHYDPTQPVTETLRGGFTTAYSLAFSVVPIVGAIVMLLFYNIGPKQIKDARAVVDARNSNA